MTRERGPFPTTTRIPTRPVGMTGQRQHEAVPNVEVPAARAAARFEHPLLGALRGRVEQAVEEQLAGTEWTARACPWLDYWFGYYEQRSPEHVEAALRKYTGVDGSTEELTEALLGRVRAAVTRWRTTGEIDAPPAVIPEPVDVMTSLGPGRALEPPVRSRMEAATGGSLAHVRVHSDATGARAAAAQSTRAVAVGDHVAFGAHQYRPGTLEGDALLAHELAHTVQQRDARAVHGGASPGLEARADGFATSALGRLGHIPGHLLRGARTAVGSTGLRLQRCPDKSKDTPTPSPTPTPGPTPPPAPVHPFAKPDIKLKMTGIDRDSKQPTIQPIDVAPDMVFERFELRKDHDVGGKTLPAGSIVRALDWTLGAPTVKVALESTPSTHFDVPKWKLRPVAARGKGVVLYMPKTTVDKQADAVQKRETALADWDKEEKNYSTNHKYWEDQRNGKPGEDGLVQKSQKSIAGLDVVMIQQLRYNLFDAMIVAEVDAANKQFKRKDPLDPNLVKSIIFRETQMGTSGSFVEDTKPDPVFDHAVINHWNITQAIDSSGTQYARVLPLEFPAIAKYWKVDDLIHQERAAQTELDGYEKTPPTDGTKKARHAELDRRFYKDAAAKRDKKRDSEGYFWSEPGFFPALKEAWATSKPALNKTYQHWIHMLVVELFDKREHAKDWADAVEKYNGISPHYREEVVDRFNEAREALKKGESIVPHHFGDK